MIWSAKQDAALQQVDAWLKDNSSSCQQVFRLFGYAGTGKTTLAKYLAESVDGLTLFAAYTGKAASVLRKSGCPDASTIHSLLYDVRPQSRMRLIEIELELAKPGIDQYTKDELHKEMASEKARLRRPKFSVNPESILRETTLLVLDECSMVNQQIAKDIEFFGCKILVLGDPAQLPPVKGSGYYTNVKPDILLDEIHRQALDSSIIRWSKRIREGLSLPMGIEGDCRRIPRASVSASLYAEYDQILTGKNETRRKINTVLRKHYNYEGTYPNLGERLVILRNEKQYGVLNGVTCVTETKALDDLEDRDAIYCNLHYEGTVIENVPLCRSQFRAYDDPARADDLDFNKRWLVPADFGYALTVHKSQGSQWEKVMLFDDGFAKRESLTRRRWLYTAITRAQKSLLVTF